MKIPKRIIGKLQIINNYQLKMKKQIDEFEAWLESNNIDPTVFRLGDLTVLEMAEYGELTEFDNEEIHKALIQNLKAIDVKAK